MSIPTLVFRRGTVLTLKAVKTYSCTFSSFNRIACVCSVKYLGTKAYVGKLKPDALDTVILPEDPKHFKNRHEAGTKVDSLEDEPGIPYPVGEQTLPHPIWSLEELQSVEITHREPVEILDKLANFHIKVLRTCFDVFSGFTFGERTEKKWLRRVVFLETVAGIPGMVGAMMRHLKSLRIMKRDHGWIHTLLEEAENERMHLMTALAVRQPGILFRLAVAGAQAVWLPCFSVAYIISPKYCHRFVGYLEEEAVKTYTKCLEDIDSGNSRISHWKTTPAPDVAVRYWQLSEKATMRDVILVIRADEAHHRTVNHTLSTIKLTDFNPYKPGE